MSNYATFSQHAKNAEYIVQDPDLWVCRRYDRLHIFNLLNLQQKLSKLEDKLDELLKQELMQKSRCLPEQMLQDQASLVEELQEAVRKYDEAICLLARIHEFQNPATHILKVFKQHINNDVNYAFQAKEFGFDEQVRVDPMQLLALTTPAKSWFHKKVDQSDRMRSLFKEKRKESESLLTYRYSEAKIRTTEFVLVTICLCLLQLLPIAGLTLVGKKALKVAIVLILIVAVSVLNSVFANTARAANFGAVAAYSAIIVVFLGQTP